MDKIFTEWKEAIQLKDWMFENVRVKEYDIAELETLFKGASIRSKYGSWVFYTSVRNRSAAKTVYFPKELQRSLSPQKEEIYNSYRKTLELFKKYALKTRFGYIKRVMGKNNEFTPVCHFFFSLRKPEYARLAYMWAKTLIEPGEAKVAPGSPEFVLIMLPEWQEKDRQILVFAEENITFVFGTDYFGEVKKGFLRMAMYNAKKRGMLGLHAGSKIIKAKTKDGLKTKGMLLFGLSGTGKTTHSVHHHYMFEDGEDVRIVQDDVVFLKEDGGCLGSEVGFFIKTDGLTRESQPVIYDAATKPGACFENVLVDLNGELLFQDLTLTGNGRGIVLASDIENMADTINLDASQIEKLVVLFITRRNTVVPPLLKLNPEQSALYFMLGESIETSASDPARAGQSVRVVGTNPFIMGAEEEEGNRFYDIVKNLGDKVEVYLFNTGGMGELKKDGEVVKPLKKIGIKESAYLIRAILREEIKYEYDETWKAYRAAKVEGVDMELDPRAYYEENEWKKLVEELKQERVEYMKQFNSLNFDWERWI